MKTVVLIGMKGCGKSTVGGALSVVYKLPFVELDEEIEAMHQGIKKEKLNCHQIVNKYHLDYFRKMENLALKKICLQQVGRSFILSCGGGTPLNPENRRILKILGTVVYLKTDHKILLARIKKDGLPSFFPKDKSPGDGLDIIMKERVEIYEKTADITVDINTEDLPEIIRIVNEAINKNEN